MSLDVVAYVEWRTGREVTTLFALSIEAITAFCKDSSNSSSTRVIFAGFLPSGARLAGSAFMCRATVESLTRYRAFTNDFTSRLRALKPSPEAPGVVWAVAGVGSTGGSGADEALALTDNLRCNHRGGALLGRLIDGIILCFLHCTAVSQGYDVVFIGHGS